MLGSRRPDRHALLLITSLISHRQWRVSSRASGFVLRRISVGRRRSGM